MGEGSETTDDEPRPLIHRLTGLPKMRSKKTTFKTCRLGTILA